MSLVLADKSLREVLRYGIGQLRDAQVSSYTLAAELLLLHVIGQDRVWLYSHPENVSPHEEVQRYAQLIERRKRGEPTQYLTGKQEFWGLEFVVTPDVLIPRSETEHAIEVTLDRLAVRDVRESRKVNRNGAGLSIADVGTGSGCIAIALAKELPGAEIYASDISPRALKVAQANAEKLGFGSRLKIAESNLLEFCWKQSSSGAPLRLDIVVSNPPYIGLHEAPTLAREVRDHEPAAALFGGEEGYELYGPLVSQAEQVLKPGGLLVLELGHESLAAVRPLLEGMAWANVGVTNDLAGIPRVICAERL